MMTMSKIRMSIIAVIAITVFGVAATQSSAIISANSASSTSAQPVLRYGARNQAVSRLQTALNARGAHLDVDGSFGPATRAAVISFQRTNRLAVDGVVGPNTWAALAPQRTTTPVNNDQYLTNLGISRAAINGARADGASLDISKRTNKAYYLKSTNGAISIAASSVVSFAGCNADGCFTTPSGVFHVLRKGGANVRSTMWNDAPMPYPLFFTTSGHALHADPLEPSHGCIHIPNINTMRYINQTIPIGAVMSIHS